MFEDYLIDRQILNGKGLFKLWMMFSKQYIEPICKTSYDFEGFFYYSIYKDKKIKKEYEEKNEESNELLNSYYVKDLQLVETGIQDKKFGENSVMEKNIIDYIISNYGKGQDEIEDKQKIDIKNDKHMLTYWLSAENLSLGKWPSRFSPALMQQVAINIGLAENEENTKIFSVNGPPGTGKTTLLKEIIANNIVERAMLLSEYDDSDNAFEKCEFSFGDKENNGYDRYFRYYYKLKNDKIKDYGMLVASCNNAAVENITLELPDGEALCGSLKGIPEIEELFNIKETKLKEKYNIKNVANGEKPDIYFSWLAHRLIKNDAKDEKPMKEWGLISAPLGKKKNISSFAFHVLNPLLDDLMKRKDIEARKEKYKEAVKVFRNQYEKVNNLKQELETISILPDKFTVLIKKMEEQIDVQTEAIETLKEKYMEVKKESEKLAVQEKNLLAEIEVCKLNIKNCNNKLSVYISEMKNLKSEKNEIMEKRFKVERFLILDLLIYKFFNYKTAKFSINEEYNQQYEYISKNCNELELIIEGLKNEIRKYETNVREDLLKKINMIKTDIEIKSNKICAYEKKIKDSEEVLEQYKLERDDITNEYEYKIKSIKRDMTIIDKEFWEKYDSSDELKATEIQTSNPWTTDAFNREREKLFYFALQLHKKFILSSKYCKCNFKNLLMMWGMSNNCDDEPVQYAKRDKEAAYTELLNTLSLLVPVISTTFASVQSFLENINKPGALGMLIIDEAGQASPQLPIGAFYRCRKAIVVGDPKQVEPVVTQDVTRIRRVFSNDNIKSYLDKKISVQQFADSINKYGTYLPGSDREIKPDWVGCPLIVHRRCISPMFDISNELSYGNMMKKKTEHPNPEKEKTFLYSASKWLDISGAAQSPNNKNYFVAQQGEEVYQMVKKAFRIKNDSPDLYIISPFVSVIGGIVERLKEDFELKELFGDKISRFCENNCGTVHKFQGKEASEVIFLLGCGDDEKSQRAAKWINSNIINVAVTRAKYRLYVVGSKEVFKNMKNFHVILKHLT
ncbi:MAG: AAA domain-containing protein [Roseburia sp.]|nr:AAA domain-containing protein [Roseburia sp.]MCM1277958.1 AAA domain-containing protein [Robinsoniella sp.]